MWSALVGALANAGVLIGEQNWWSLLLLRFLTGFCLAGIYPVGMKIAADYYEKGLGKALGYLVGALVLGTAFPHLLKSFGGLLEWTNVILTSSILAIFGGLLIGFGVPDGPFRKASSRLDFTVIFRVFQEKRFRAAAFGYFGHMWELYAFWAFIPVILETYGAQQNWDGNISLWAFGIIAIGGLACALGGWWSQRIGSASLASFALGISGLCCIFSPWMFNWPVFLFLGFLFDFGGMSVVADSPQFSTLVARYAPPSAKGSALTIVNCLGFAIYYCKVFQLLSMTFQQFASHYVYWLLVLGPIFGWIKMRPLKSL